MDSEGEVELALQDMRGRGGDLTSERHAAAAQGKRESCPGIPIGSGESQIDCVEASCNRWMCGGCIRTQSAPVEPDREGKQAKAKAASKKTEVLDLWERDMLRLRSSVAKASCTWGTPVLSVFVSPTSGQCMQKWPCGPRGWTSATWQGPLFRTAPGHRETQG